MPARKLPPNDILVKMYQSGMSTSEISENLGNVKPVTVVSMLRRIGVKMRAPADADRLARSKNRKSTTKYWEGKKQPTDMVERRAAKTRGENHYLWKGGKAKRDYRKVIDKVECFNCGEKENLNIHHVDGDHYNNSNENLMVLCVSCHLSYHKKEYWAAIREGKEPPKTNAPIGWNKPLQRQRLCQPSLLLATA